MSFSTRSVYIIGFAPEWPDWTLRPSGAYPDSGCRVVFVEEPDVARKRRVREAVAEYEHCELVEIEYQLPGALERFLARHPDAHPAAVVPGIEYAVPFAARLAAHYGLPGAGAAAADALRDKALLREITAAHGVPNPVSRRAESAADLAAFADRHGFPLIVKPADRQGSVGTRIVTDAADLERAWADVREQDEPGITPDRPIPPRMLVEEFVPGPGFCVIMLVAGGEPVFATVAAKGLFPGDRPVECWHQIPADIPDEAARRMIEQTRQVVAAVGMADGVVGCEWILPSDGTPRLVECAGRLVGDLLIPMTELAHGIDVPGALIEILTTGHAPKVDLTWTAQRHCSVQFLAADPGSTLRAADPLAVYELPGVLLADVFLTPGERVPVLRSSHDRIAAVLVEGPDGPTTRARAEAAASALSASLEFEGHQATGSA
ncbi:MAG TPA: ATP-grasp domain-containing protein [Actinospica sp.]|jgi:biotin carboxylase|nr:ATP-grasp domain-containing protein [Actinospica sp.]